jgi:hypothetical protein
MSCNNNGKKHDDDTEGCEHCNLKECPSHPVFVETMRGINRELHSYVEDNAHLRQALKMFDEHLTVARVLTDLFSSNLPPTTLVNFSFKVEVPNGDSLRVFRVDSFSIPVAGLFRVFDPLLRTTLLIVKDFYTRLKDAAFMMNVTDQIRNMVQQAHEEEEEEPEQSELN